MTMPPVRDKFPASLLPWWVPAALAAAAVVLLWLLSDVILLLFASILIAIALCGLAKPITANLGVPHPVAVLIIGLIALGLIGLSLRTYGPRLWTQFDNIAVHIPEAIAYIREGVESHPSGRLVEEMIAGFDLSKAAAPVAQQVRVLLTSIGTLMSYTVFMFFAGIYLALDPDRYIRGLVYFTPVKNRNEVRQFIARAGTTLRTWLLTQLLVVVVNGIFAGLGLWVLGVESAIALGLLAGILSFIPYVGTIIAMVIGALAALPQGAEFALYTLVVLGIVSFVEGYFVTPYVQSRALSIPPVVLLVAMFAFTILFGASGIVLAAPLTIVLMAALDTIYVPQDEATGPVA